MHGGLKLGHMLLAALAIRRGHAHARSHPRRVDIQRSGALDNRLHLTSQDLLGMIVAPGASENRRV
jgi:hypothetical protein